MGVFSNQQRHPDLTTPRLSSNKHPALCSVFNSLCENCSVKLGWIHNQPYCRKTWCYTGTCLLVCYWLNLPFWLITTTNRMKACTVLGSCVVHNGITWRCCVGTHTGTECTGSGEQGAPRTLSALTWSKHRCVCSPGTKGTAALTGENEEQQPLTCGRLTHLTLLRLTLSPQTLCCFGHHVLHPDPEALSSVFQVSGFKVCNILGLMGPTVSGDTDMLVWSVLNVKQ